MATSSVKFERLPLLLAWPIWYTRSVYSPLAGSVVVETLPSREPTNSASPVLPGGSTLWYTLEPPDSLTVIVCPAAARSV